MPLPAPIPAPPELDLDVARPLIDHLLEIRRRLLWCGASVAVFSVIGWYTFDGLLHRLIARVGPLYYLTPTEAFATQFKMAVLLGTFLSAPVILYHLWRFVGLALTVGEKQIFQRALPFSYLLFLLGVCFGWTTVVPLGLRFLSGFHTPGLLPMWSVSACLEFALWTSGGLGVLFQLPVVLSLLASWGFVTAETLGRYRRHALLILLVVSAVVTPGPDVLSQLLLSAPAYALYELSILLVRAIEFRRKKARLTAG